MKKILHLGITAFALAAIALSVLYQTASAAGPGPGPGPRPPRKPSTACIVTSGLCTINGVTVDFGGNSIPAGGQGKLNTKKISLLGYAAYIKIVDANGALQPSFAVPVKLCFDVPAGHLVYWWNAIAGNWFTLPTFRQNGLTCAWISSPGQFVVK
jgi:hypothetical protein